MPGRRHFGGTSPLMGDPYVFYITLSDEHFEYFLINLQIYSRLFRDYIKLKYYLSAASHRSIFESVIKTKVFQTVDDNSRRISACPTPVAYSIECG